MIAHNEVSLLLTAKNTENVLNILRECRVRIVDARRKNEQLISGESFTGRFGFEKCFDIVITTIAVKYVINRLFAGNQPDKPGFDALRDLVKDKQIPDIFFDGIAHIRRILRLEKVRSGRHDIFLLWVRVGDESNLVEQVI